jgi:hypothetical protein
MVLSSCFLLSFDPSTSIDAAATAILPGVTDDKLIERCRETLAGNWVEGHGYTKPSPNRYPWQWYWDSCFTAIVWRRFDAARSRRELEALLSAQRDDGFIGHTIFWDGPLHGPRRLFYNVLGREDRTTATIQPPLLAWAWRIAVGDPREVPAIARHHEWLERERALDGDGLLWIIQPDESGLDASPQFDPVWGRRAHGTPGFVGLVRHNRRLAFDAQAIARAGGPLVCEVVTNVLWGLSRIALGAPSITPVLVERLWDEERGLFLPLVRPQARLPIPATIAALTPLALPDLPEEIGHRLVREQLLDPGRFWTPVAPPSVSVAEPTFVAGREHFHGLRRYWRGPTWVNVAWLVWIGLRRLGYEEEARTLADGVCEAVLREGPREFYDPRNGRGMGAREFGWSTLAVELEVGDESGSYLSD